MKICVLIPVHNEAQEIGRVLKTVKLQGLEVLVIDDGSTDNSGTIAKQRGAMVVRHDQRCGKGLSLREGFKQVLKNQYDGVMTMDGDGQHDPADLHQFFDKIKEDPISIVTGNRMRKAHRMPWIRYWTNRFMSFLISCICKQSIPDTQCGFRYIHRKILEEIEITCNDFEVETEVLIQASKRGYQIHSVPVKTIYRGEKSKIRLGKDTIRFFNYLIREMTCRRNS